MSTITFKLIGPRVRKPGKKAVRTQHRRSRSSLTVKHAQSIGLRIGYWPCLGGPFVVLYVGSHQLEAWYGLPTYRKDGDR